MLAAGADVSAVIPATMVSSSAIFAAGRPSMRARSSALLMAGGSIGYYNTSLAATEGVLAQACRHREHEREACPWGTKSVENSQ